MLIQEQLNKLILQQIQINFTANLDRAGNTTMFFIIEKVNETVLDFSQETVKVL